MPDLSDFTPSSDEIVVTLKNPKDQTVLTNDSDQSEMTWTLYAPHTKEYKKVMYDYTDARVKKMRTPDGKFDPNQISMAETDEENLKQLVDVTKGFNLDRNGERLKFSKTKAKEVLDQFFWIKPQLEEALETYEVFTNT